MDSKPTISLRALVLSGLAAWGALALIVFTLPLAFSAVARGGSAVWVFYPLTESGGYLGSTVIVILTGIWLVTRGEAPLARRLAAALIVIGAVGAALLGVAYLNERIVKRRLDVPRPSHELLRRRGVLAERLASFYQRPRDERRRVLRSNLELRRSAVADIDPLVLHHWSVEVGRSFPSGHALNAFLLAGFLAALALYFGVGWGAVAAVFTWALLVAVSRVALGVHSKWDVTVGALAGLATVLVLVASGAVPWFLGRLFHRGPRTIALTAQARRSKFGVE